MRRRVLVVLLLVVMLLVGSELLVPVVMSKVLQQGVKTLTGSEQVDTTLRARPALLMLTGQFDTVHIVTNHAKFDKFTFSELEITLAHARLDMGKLWSEHLVALQAVQEIDIQAKIGQEELAQYLNQSVKGVKNATVVITPDKIKANSTFVIGSFAQVPVSLEGRIVSDSQKIKFVTDRFLINNTAVGMIGGSLLTEISLLELNKLPFHTTVRNIVMENGQVRLYLDNHSQ